MPALGSAPTRHRGCHFSPSCEPDRMYTSLLSAWVRTQRMGRSLPKSYSTKDRADKKREVTSVSHSSPSLQYRPSVSRPGFFTPWLRLGSAPAIRLCGSGRAGVSARATLASAPATTKRAARETRPAGRCLGKRRIATSTCDDKHMAVERYVRCAAQSTGGSSAATQRDCACVIVSRVTESCPCGVI